MRASNEHKSISRLRDVRGISRAVVIMLILVAVMLVVVSIPVYIHFRTVWREMECMTSLDTAKRQMIDQFLLEFGDLDIDEAKEHVGYVMNGWDDLCPGGGIVYIVKDDDPNADMPYKLVCGVHGEDKKENCRLNADYVLDHVRERVKYERAKGAPIPEKITVNLNGEDLDVLLVTESKKIRYGTRYFEADDDIVAYYGVAGNGFDDTTADDGEVCYFGFADPNYCANWTAERGWSGDSWDKTANAGEVLPG